MVLNLNGGEGNRHAGSHVDVVLSVVVTAYLALRVSGTDS